MRNSQIALILLAMFVLTWVQNQANAGDEWRIERVDATSYPSQIVLDTRKPASNGIPSGRIAKVKGKCDVIQAWYTQPTTRYAHAILGDNIEAGAIRIKTSDGRELEFILPHNQVFEDLTPRIADLDQDGSYEIITILSGANEGGSIAIFGLRDGELKLLAQSPYIGRSNRWLNVAGIGHYQGLNTLEIALVVTPHIGGRLDLYTYKNRKLTRIAASQGFSNHEIGSEEQRLSTTYRPEGEDRDYLALPSANRRTLKIMSLKSNNWHHHANINLPASIDKAIGLKQEDDKVTFTLGLSNGTVLNVSNR